MLTISAQDLAKIDSLLYKIETATDDSARVYLNVAISNEYSNSDVISSLNYGERALAIAEKSKNENLISYALFNLGIAYFYQGVIEISIKYFYRYLDIKKIMKDEAGIAYAWINLGTIHLNLKQYDQAREHFEQAIATFNKLNEKARKPGYELITIYNNLGVLEKEQHQIEKAIDYFERGIILGKRTPGQETNLGNLLNNLANAYLDQGKMEEAYQYLMEALTLRIKHDDQSGMIKSYLSLAKYFQKKNNEEQVFEYVYSAYNLASRVGMMSSIADAQKFLFGIYHQKGVADSALKYHILYADFREKMNEESALKELKHMEITTRFKENETLMQLEQKRKESRYLLAGLTLLLTIIILSLLYFLASSRNRRLKLEKENIFLNAKNLALEKTNLEKELDVRNKELATNVMYQIQKNELINEIVQKLQTHSTSDSKKYPSWVLEIIKDLEKTQDRSVWNEFEIRFQQVHNDFYNKLNEINPELTPNERRLCAFLRLNMTTKEISSITGQSYRSIEVARTRLRKKLNLTNSETGLIEFLSTL